MASGCLERPVARLQPSLTNMFVDHVPIDNIDKIDLLFVADNSISMGDKQKLFQKAVPQMVKRLVSPDCVKRDENQAIVERHAPTGSACTEGFAPEFTPIHDIHVAVISSSLGANGANGVAGACSDPALPEKDDRARPMPLVRPAAGLGSEPFLTWNGTADPDQFAADVARQISAAGEQGCGYEATMESWYRFLVDPNPPLKVTSDAEANSLPEGRDEELLELRRKFLRPDSLVAIVVLSDENDCSIMNGGSYYPFAAGGARLSVKGSGEVFAATPSCAENPNSLCCWSCLRANSSNIPEECKAEVASACAAKPELPITEDRANLRCFDQKERFGIDLLYPIERYVDGLTKGTVPDWREPRGAPEVPNPLLRGVDGNSPRPNGRVFFAGVVGVPWQDVATTESLGDPTRLTYLRASELSEPVPGQAFDRWSMMIGKPGHAKDSLFCLMNPSEPSCGAEPVLPQDPFMIESVDPRPLGQKNPITGDAITADGTWNSINGHEYNNDAPGSDGKPSRDELQYACIFPLEPYEAEVGPEACNDALAHANCSCVDEPSKNRSICQGRGGTEPATNRQSFGRAFPGTRILQTLQGFGENSIVASICPKVHENPSSPSYGYNPAVSAIVDRLAEKLGGTCLPRRVSYDERTHKVPCTVVEVRATALGELSCSRPGRSEPGADLRRAVLRQAEALDLCSGEESCAAYQMCEVQQLVANDGVGGNECLSSDVYPGAASGLEPGFCYVDPEQGSGAPSLVATCREGEKRKLRLVGEDTPADKTTLFIACLGDASVD